MTTKISVVVVVCAVLIAVPGAAQCTPVITTVSQAFVFPNRSAGPIAWTGSFFGVAKTDSDVVSKSIWFGIYDHDLNQIGGDVEVADHSAAGAAALLWTGSEFGLFYQDYVSSQILLQRIDATGHPVGSAVAVAPGHLQFPLQEFDVAWDASRQSYVVVRANNQGTEQGLWLTVVDSSGTTTSDDFRARVANPASPRVSVTSNGTILVIWLRVLEDVPELAAAIVVPGKLTESITRLAKDAASPRVATDDKSFFIVYNAPNGSGSTAIRSTKLDLTGRVIAPDALVVAGGVDVVPFSLIVNKTLGEWALAYVNYPAGVRSGFGGETRLRRIYFANFPAGDMRFSDDSTKFMLAPLSDVVWTGSGYVMSIGRGLSRIEGTESYIERKCPLVVTVTATPSVNLPGAITAFSAQVTGGAGPYTFAWTFGDLDSGSGQTINHRYMHLGTYTASVTATDVNGQQASAAVIVQVANLKRRAAQH